MARRAWACAVQELGVPGLPVKGRGFPMTGARAAYHKSDLLIILFRTRILTGAIKIARLARKRDAS